MNAAEALKLEIESSLGLRIHGPEDLARIAAALDQSPDQLAHRLGRPRATLTVSNEPSKGLSLIAVRIGAKKRDFD